MLSRRCIDKDIARSIWASSHDGSFQGLSGGLGPAVSHKRGTSVCCRGLVRVRDDALLHEEEDWQERGSQSRQVRQRQNPEEPSDLTSIRDLLEEITQETHEGICT